MSLKSLCLSLVMTLAGVLVVVPSLQAQIAPPVVNRPKEFSHVVGSYRILKYTAGPTDVQVEDPITFEVWIAGSGPKEYQPKRKNLHLFRDEDFEQFYIDPVADQERIEPGDNGETIWKFVYLLKPKSTRVKVVPLPQLVYYDPGQGRSFQTAIPDPDIDPIALTVRPRREYNANEMAPVAGANERLFALITGDAVLARDDVQPYWTTGILIGVIAGMPLVSLAGFVLLRRLFPDGARKLQWNRNQAARRAVRELTHQKPCSPGQTVKILTGYLSQRLDFPAVEPTPHEVAQWLRRRGFALPVRQRWADFLRGCDEVRFTPPNGQPVDATGPVQAIELIHALEADPCLATSRR